MVGYRRSHDYPHGKPFPLLVLSIAMGFLGLLWVFSVPGHWPRALGMVSAVLVIAFIDSRLRSRYERSGLAVRIPSRESLLGFPTVYLEQCWRLVLHSLLPSQP